MKNTMKKDQEKLLQERKQKSLLQVQLKSNEAKYSDELEQIKLKNNEMAVEKEKNLKYIEEVQ